MNKKILFIQPTIYDDEEKLLKKKKLYFVGLAHPLLAALLPEGWCCEICLEVIEEIPWDTDCDVVGIGCVGHAAKRAKDIATEFRKRGKIVLMGGPMASLVPKLAKQYCDSVIIGDAEEVMVSICKDIENNCLKDFYENPLTSLSFPLPRYDLVVNKKIGHFLPVQAGRGCSNTCSFCTIACLFNGKYIRRTIDEVMRDIKYVKSLGFNEFSLVDDNIISDPNYMLELCRLITPLKMKWMSQCAIQIADNDELLSAVSKSGCYVLSFGLESIVKEAMKQINKTWADPKNYLRIIKKVNEAGIEVSSEMIIGLDTDTVKTLDETIEFVKKSNIIAPKFYCLTPIPGTPLNIEMNKRGSIVDSNVLEYKPSKSVNNTPNFTAAEVTGQYWRVYKELYTIRTILRRTIFNKRMLKHPLRTTFFFAVNMVYRGNIKRKIAPNIF